MPQADEAIPLLRFKKTMGFIKFNAGDCFMPRIGIRNDSLTLCRYGSPINRDFVPFYGTQHSARIHLLLSAHPELVEGHERFCKWLTTNGSGNFLFVFLQNQHGIAEAVEAVILFDGFPVGLLHKYHSSERAYHHQ